MLQIAICDDNSQTLKDLYTRTTNYLKNNKILARISTYSQSILLQFDIQEKKYFDLILTDIEMPDIDGMTLASYIKKYLPNTLIIFITSHLKYAIDAFELSIFRYVPKANLNKRLEHALEDAIMMIQLQSKKCYIINTPRRMEKILYKDILYIQRNGKNSLFTLSTGTKTQIRKSLNQVFSEIDSNDFIFIDRGTIVNLAHILRLKDSTIQLSNGTLLPVSHTRLKSIKGSLNSFWEENTCG